MEVWNPVPWKQVSFSFNAYVTQKAHYSIRNYVLAYYFKLPINGNFYRTMTLEVPLHLFNSNSITSALKIVQKQNSATSCCQIKSQNREGKTLHIRESAIPLWIATSALFISSIIIKYSIFWSFLGVLFVKLLAFYAMVLYTVLPYNQCVSAFSFKCYSTLTANTGRFRTC